MSVMLSELRAKKHLSFPVKIFFKYFLLSALLLPLSFSMAQESAKYNNIKTVFIYNFTKYIDWPAPRKKGDFVIGVFNGGSFAEGMRTVLSNKTVDAQKIIIREYAALEEIEKKCHILVIPGPLTDKYNDWVVYKDLVSKALKKVAGTGTLLVSDGLSCNESMINFKIVEKGSKGLQKIEINTNAIKNQGLSVARELLALAILCDNEGAVTSAFTSEEKNSADKNWEKLYSEMGLKLEEEQQIVQSQKKELVELKEKMDELDRKNEEKRKELSEKTSVLTEKETEIQSQAVVLNQQKNQIEQKSEEITRLAKENEQQQKSISEKTEILIAKEKEIGDQIRVLNKLKMDVHAREMQLAGQDKMLNQQLKDISKQKFIIYGIIGMFAVSLGFALFMVRTYRKIKKAEEQLIIQKEKLSQTLLNLQQTQSQLIQSEKMAALGQLIAGVAHEVNTPLGAIKSSVENISEILNREIQNWPDFFRKITPENETIFFNVLAVALKKDLNITSREERVFKKELTKKLESLNIPEPSDLADILVDIGFYNFTDEYNAFLQSENCHGLLMMIYKFSGLINSSKTIQTATERASKTVFALKNFAHFDNSGEPVSANVIHGIETILTLYHNTLKHGIEVVKNYTEVPAISCFPDELNQVWTNVVHNSVQAMKNKGKLTIDVKQVRDNVCVSFTDTGCGIPPEIKDKIFDPFFTTKSQGEGSGLGLDIVRRIIEKHCGKIEVTSEPLNTEFKFYLPLNTKKESYA